MYKVVITDIKTGDVLLDTKMGCANSEYPNQPTYQNFSVFFQMYFLTIQGSPLGV